MQCKDRQADAYLPKLMCVMNNSIPRTYTFTFTYNTDPHCHDEGKFMSVRFLSCEGSCKNIISYNLMKK